jgi:hypothetical protein
LDPHVIHTKEDREREDRPRPKDAGKQRGSPELAAPGDGGLADVEEMAGKDHGVWAHP